MLPPRIAPVQAMVIPIQQQKDGVLDTAKEVCERIGKVCRAKLDDSDKSPGWKFSEQEMRGIPVRIELGPKDIAAGKCVAVRRDTREMHISGMHIITKNLPRLQMRNRALSVQCGVGIRLARTRLKKTLQ